MEVKVMAKSKFAISPGFSSVQSIFGSGLHAGLHEIYPHSNSDIGAATGFAASLARLSSGERNIVWIRQDFLDTETGALNASGLAELGVDLERFILVRARETEGVLRAGEQAASQA